MRKKSEFLSAFGITMEIWKALVDEVLSLGGGDDELRLIQTDSDLRHQLAEAIMVVSRKVSLAFKVLVDYSQSLEQAIKAGKYDWVSDNITQEHFPKTKDGQVEAEVELLHFNRTISSENALAEMKIKGYRPATIEELLALGAKYPELQRQFPIVALGSIWSGPSGSRCVPYLDRDASERDLGLDALEGDWSDNYRFAVVRELS